MQKVKRSDLEDHAAWEPGVEWGASVTGARLRAGVRGRETWGVLGTREHRRWLEAEMRWGLGRDRFVGAAVSHQRELHQYRNLVTCSYGFTF